MKFGVTTYIWTLEFNESHLSLLPQIKEGGFDGVEIPLFHPKGFPAAGIRKGVEANGLECNASVVLMDGLSLISEDPDVRRRTRAHLVDTIQVAAELGARIIAGPVYSPVGYLPGRRRTTDEWNWAVEGYQSLGETLAANAVTLAIEPLNRFETYFLNTAADAAALCEQVGHPNVGILFDTFHANIEEKDIAAGYRTLGRHLKHVHTCENDRGTPGSGHVEWNAVFQALRDLHYDGWLVIEGFSFALGDLSAAASLWRDIEVTPEVIAFEGVKFLRRNMA
jgi:D-psicose/D-tagatose/L-ribulose 3-epimerase